MTPLVLALAIANVLFGCCLNVVSLEYVTKFDKGAGHLLTFAQFAFIVMACMLKPYLVAVCTRSAWPPAPFSLPLTLPLRAHHHMAVTFFALSVINNKALDYHIPMPLHMIFRSSSLVTTLLVGALFWRRPYTVGQWFGCALVSVGIFVATIADAASSGKLSLACCGGWLGGSVGGVAASGTALGGGSSGGGLDALVAAVREAAASVDATWLTGVALLSVALVLTSYLSFNQETSFKAHGKNVEEALLYSHLLSLPYFLFFADDIWKRACSWYALPPMRLFVVGVELEVSVWWPLAVNALSQYLCIAAVYHLISVSNALTSTLVLTLRKFLSLLFSLAFFGHAFTGAHWLGTALVFVGSLTYSFGGDCGCGARPAAEPALPVPAASDTTDTESSATSGTVVRRSERARKPTKLD